MPDDQKPPQPPVPPDHIPQAPVIEVPAVEQDDNGKIESATEYAFNALVKQCLDSGLKVANVPFEAVDDDEIGRGFQDACRCMVEKLMQIAGSVPSPCCSPDGGISREVAGDGGTGRGDR